MYCDCFRLFRQIATAVYYCHIHKICHRDLKLENVLLDDTGSAKVGTNIYNIYNSIRVCFTYCYYNECVLFTDC